MYCKDRPPKQKKDAGGPAAKPSGGGDKYCAHLLEVNCNPSLGIDSVYPCEGPAATRPVPPPASASWAAEWHEAMEVRVHVLLAAFVVTRLTFCAWIWQSEEATGLILLVMLLVGNAVQRPKALQMQVAPSPPPARTMCN